MMGGAGSSGTAPGVLSPGRFDVRFARVFAWWTRRMIRKDFHAVRLARGGRDVLEGLAAHPAPVIGVSNHLAWWDPLVFVLLHRRFMWGRGSIGPVDMPQWERFGFMRRLGLFGIEPDDPRAPAAMVEHVVGEMVREPRTTFWLTPQGQFVDPRVPVRPRPGVAMVAASACGRGLDVRAVSIAIEYVFWLDRRPELLLRVAPVLAPSVASASGASSSTAAWHRAFTRSMAENQSALGALAMARDPAAFETIEGGDAGRVNPAYDLWQRLRGRGGAIETRQAAR